MGKNKNKHQQHQQSVSSNSHPHAGAVPAGPVTPYIRALAEKANSLMTEAEVANPPVPPPNPSSEQIDPIALWRMAHQSNELFEHATSRAEAAAASARERDEEARKLGEELEKREKQLTAQRDAQRQIQREVEESKQSLARRERHIVEEEGKLKEREIAAEAGFLQQHRQVLVKLEEEAKALAKQISDHHLGYLASLKDYEASIRQIRDRELAGLEEQRREFEAQKLELGRLKREAEWARQDAEEIKANWVSRVEARVQEAVTDRDARLQSALETCRELAQRISRYEQAESLAAGKTREELVAELRDAQEQKAKLVAELSRKPGDQQVARLANLERERETLSEEISTLRQRNQALELQLGKLSIGIAEMQNLRDQKLAWESREAALRMCTEDLRKELGELVDKSKAQHVFPSLIGMDSDAELQTAPEATLDGAPFLRELVEQVRHRIAGEKLFYREKDIRAFLAGLAASRLHLLQGISGTGKTSLPLAFARAIGARSSLIEVQSGWRDRNDLLGYYNAFERRFYESEFLQALYRAQQPRHQSLPYFIVLDEMNLSHPEHYFADFLSALEQKPANQRISLLTSKVDGAPRLLEEARWLRIPENVWFIGTANHDETTKDFAPKTYDRAHVMEFPRHPEGFAVRRLSSPHSVTMNALQSAFANAKLARQKEAKAVSDLLEKGLKEDLARLGLGWGNRLDRQIDSFVPVIIEAGGNPGEAADHIIATKLLRKLSGRFDLSASQLRDFQGQLKKAWARFDEGNPPEKCEELLNKEIKRLSGGTA